MVGSFTLDLDRTAEPGRVYWYRLAWSTAVEEGRSAPIEARVAEIERVGLRAIGPNPTRGDVEIQYALGTRSSVDLTIHDVMGREVASLASGPQAGGVHIVHWASTQSGRRVRPGVYFVRLRWTGGQESRRVIVRP
jgi:hypothetical protein